MQYPELNIGEFASRHSATIELEKPEDKGYLLKVAVEPHENEEGYSVNIGAKPQQQMRSENSMKTSLPISLQMS